MPLYTFTAMVVVYADDEDDARDELADALAQMSLTDIWEIEDVI